MAEQIERQFHYHGRHGGGNRNRHSTYAKQVKNCEERRKGKQFTEDDDGEPIPKHAATYRKYDGWEY